MKAVVRTHTERSVWPDPWQIVVVALCTLVLCSCRAPSHAIAPAEQAAVHPSMPADPNNGVVIPAGLVEEIPVGPPGMEQGVPLPYEAYAPWTPPGLPQPWPQDEYLRDGGDHGLPVKVARHSEVLGLEMEDTVAQFDTLEGKTVIEPSNRVAIYSPRFGAVRQVVGAASNEERQKATGVIEPTRISSPQRCQIVAGAKQNLQPTSEDGANPALALRTRRRDGVVSSVIGPKGFQGRFKAYENLAIIRQGMFEGSEMPMLARGSTAAIAWSNTQSVQVILDEQNATADVKYDQAMSLYTVSSPPGKPRLQLVKVASTPFAQPGDVVDFTLRFDNVGNQTITHVAIIDNLTTRLEYVPDSAQCSLDAQFRTEPNEGDSVVLRCELIKPLEPGQGGLLRFRCRVR